MTAEVGAARHSLSVADLATWVRRSAALIAEHAEGIIATSGMAYVAADLLVPSAPTPAKATLAAALTAVAAVIDLYELRAVDIAISNDMLCCLDALRWGRADLVVHCAAHAAPLTATLTAILKACLAFTRQEG